MNRTGNLDLIKKINRSLVLEMIRNEQPISRAKISKKLGLSRSTVTLMVNDLLMKKFVVELGLGESTKEGGRKGMDLVFNPKSGYGIGIDIGRTKFLIVITDLDGDIVYKEIFKPTSSLEELAQIIQGTIDRSAIDPNIILGMGIGLPGIVNSTTGVVIDLPILNWININLIKELEPHFRFPIYVNNDVNCAALGERWLDREEKIDNLFFIAIGTGVGSAIISKGELIEGHMFSAGEINCFIDREDLANHRRNERNGVGVFESQIAGPALSRFGYSSKEIFAEYQTGNKEALPVVDSFILHLSIAIANVVSLLNPQKVIIGGGVSESMAVVIEKIRQTVSELTPIRTEIELARLGGNAGALGAVAYVFEKLQEAEVL